jgi:hypothetical protein
MMQMQSGVPIVDERCEVVLSSLVDLLVAPDGSTRGAVRAAQLPPLELCLLLGLLTELVSGSVRFMALMSDGEYTETVASVVGICRQNLAGS